MRVSSEGFTIVEVMLFLGISGMLLLMVIIGSGMMAARQRFTDTTDSLETRLVSEYDQVANGVNTRGASSSCPSDTTTIAGTSKNCLLLGRLLTISDDRQHIDSRYVVSTSASVNGLSDADKLLSVGPTVVDDSMTTYELKWGATIFSASRSTVGASGTGRGVVDTIAILRIPDSGQMAQLYYEKGTTGMTARLRQVLSDSVEVSRALNPPATNVSPSLALCLRNNSDFGTQSVRSALYFGQGSASAGITTNYNPGRATCP